MSRKALTAVTVVALLALVAGGSLVYSFLKPPEEASGAIQAIPLEQQPQAASVAAADAAETPEPKEPAEDETQASVAATPVKETAAEPSAPAREAVAALKEDTHSDASEDPPQPAAPDVATDTAVTKSEEPASKPTAPPAKDAAEATTAPQVTDTPAPAAPAPRQRVFQIDPDGSTAQFNIDEVLRGEPKTVIGSTDQVAGQFGMLGSSLSTVTVGPVLVNARTFMTDNKFRDRSIKNKILKTDDYEYIRFEPTGVEGIPETASPGEEFTFQVTGNLTITDVTHPVTFQMRARFVTDNEIEGLGKTSFPYTDFNLYIPKPPVVASVADTVHLEVKFQAKEVY